MTDPTAGIGIHPTKAWLSQLVNFKNAIWTLEEQYAIKFCFKLGKNAMRWKLDLLLWPRHQEIEFPVEACWSPRPKKARQSTPTHKLLMIPFLTALAWVTWTLRDSRKRFRRKRPALFKSGQWHFHQDNAPVHNSILVTDYLNKMGINTVSHPPYSRDLAPCDFWLFPKLRGYRYETIEEMKEAVTRSHKRTSMEPSRSCWNGTSALQPEEITPKKTRVSCVYY